MNKTVLINPSYPQMIQNFARENFNLKILSGACLALLFVSLATVAYLVKRGPMVIAMSESGKVTQIETKVTDFQIKEAIRVYLNHRYGWDDKNIGSSLRLSEFFVEPSLVGSFRKSMSDTIKYVHDKKVSQRVYPREDSIKVDLKEKSVTLVADRFTEFDNLKAATEMKLKLWFEKGDQTIQNPWGVYVVKELEGGGTR
jgi:hypothetical protein